jgi:RNA polymerase primary sigma factor
MKIKLILITIKEELNKTLSVLDDREKEIVKIILVLTHFEPMTLEAIGEKYSLTKERIRQIKEAIRKLRHNSNGLFTLMNH